ncbi:hypothetical protein WMW72_24820 [Paenibacillus filicis]|uniref:Uncharacterized protein n=1 Tax=Paenibacillus filicis TaxID=669464 RepID=A0ABU9DQL4_9BACL
MFHQPPLDEEELPIPPWLEAPDDMPLEELEELEDLPLTELLPALDEELADEEAPLLADVDELLPEDGLAALLPAVALEPAVPPEAGEFLEFKLFPAEPALPDVLSDVVKVPLRVLVVGLLAVGLGGVVVLLGLVEPGLTLVPETIEDDGAC